MPKKILTLKVDNDVTPISIGREWLNKTIQQPELPKAKCPCCDQVVQIKTVPLDPAILLPVLLFYKEAGTYGPYADLRLAVNNNYPFAVAMDEVEKRKWQLASYWGLLESKSVKKVTKYRVTQVAADFFAEKISLPLFLRMYNNKMAGFSPDNLVTAPKAFEPLDLKRLSLKPKEVHVYLELLSKGKE